MRRAHRRGRSRPTRRRLTLAFSAVFLAILAALLVGPGSASALGFDCKDAPAPEIPGRGLTGFFAGEPKALAPAGDPFVPNATTTIYEQYGYAGLRWNNYDLGCGPDATRAPDAVAGTAIANWLFNLPKVAVAFTNAVVSVAFEPSFFSVFDPVVSDVSDALYTHVFAALVPLTLAATGTLLLWRAKRANFASSTAAAAWALLVLVIATALFRWPVEAGSSADASMSAALGSVSRTVGGQPANASGPTSTAAATHEALLYNAWLAGMFGDPESETARKYGPAIFDASALTWREARTLREDPDKGKKIISAKQHKFADTAERIKDADPDAYQYLIGKRSDARVGYALLAAFGALCALPFLFGAALLVLASFLIMRVSVMLFPAVATLGVFPAMRQTVVNVFGMVAGALVNALLFGVAAAVALRGIGLLLAPGAPLPEWLAITLLLLFTGVLWVALRPVRRMALMVGADVGLARSRTALVRALGLRRRAGATVDRRTSPPRTPNNSRGRTGPPRQRAPRRSPCRRAGRRGPVAGGPGASGARRGCRGAREFRERRGQRPDAERTAGPARTGLPPVLGPIAAVAGVLGERRPAELSGTPAEAFAAADVRRADVAHKGVSARNGSPHGGANGAPPRWTTARPQSPGSGPAPAVPAGATRTRGPRPAGDDAGRLYVPAGTTPTSGSSAPPPPLPADARNTDAGDLADLSGIYRPGDAGRSGRDG